MLRINNFFVLNVRILGWHMLEMGIAYDQPLVTLKLFLDAHPISEQSTSFELPFKNGSITKRLIYSPKCFQRLRIQSIDVGNEYATKHLRMVWLPPWFAHDRLAQRLVNMHHLYRDLSKSQVLSHIKQTAKTQGIHWRDLALQHYDETFQRHNPLTSYPQWLHKQTPISQSQALETVQTWAHQPLVSILLYGNNPNSAYINQCITALQAQYYPHWELCRVDGKSATALNAALSLAKGEFLALLDHDDCLTPDALFQVVKALQTQPDAGLLYS